MSVLNELATEHGFAACYVLRPERFIHYERRLLDGALHTGGMKLTYDLSRELPWANALVVLIRPYEPYSRDVPLSSNYPAANAAYHAVDALLPRLMEAGIRAERCHVPLRELLMRSGVGVALKNGQTAIPPYGSRFSVQALAASLPSPRYDDAPPRGECENCGACAAACPAGAIGEDGFDYRKCLRAYMGKEPMPDWVMRGMTTMLGCELCQNACPFNAGLLTDDALPECFSYERLLQNDLRDALALVGFNQKSGGRLIAHAAVMAANVGRRELLPLIEPLQNDPREAVRIAAAYAISKLHNEKSMV